MGLLINFTDMRSAENLGRIVGCLGGGQLVLGGFIYLRAVQGGWLGQVLKMYDNSFIGKNIHGLNVICPFLGLTYMTLGVVQLSASCQFPKNQASVVTMASGCFHVMQVLWRQVITSGYKYPGVETILKESQESIYQCCAGVLLLIMGYSMSK